MRAGAPPAPTHSADLVPQSSAYVGEAGCDEDADANEIPLPLPDNESRHDLILSAHQGTNADIFPQILALHVPAGSTVADVTYGRGVFWRWVPDDAYRLLATDILTGTDCRALPYANGSVDCVVLDPPYMHSPGGTAHVNHQNFEQYYRNNEPNGGSTELPLKGESTDKRPCSAGSGAKYHEAVLNLYYAAADEALRVLHPGGVFIVKCQDQVCAGRQRWMHVDIINELTGKGYVLDDLFILMRHGRPGVSRLVKQLHARKNHSYFLVFLKPKG
jgi:hypothetical protein